MRSILPGGASSQPARAAGGRRRSEPLIAKQEPGPSEQEHDASRWADRGWYVAVEYGVLARDRFLSRLPHLRQLGTFKELLESGGKILYRNIFREDQVDEAWQLITALRPWSEQLSCYLKGQQVSLKLAQDVLWCAAFLTQEGPCRGPESKKERPVGCPGAQVLLGPGRWEHEDETTRHALTFARVDERGALVLDREAIAEFVHRGALNRLCPISPARNPARFAAAFEDVPVRALGWALVAEMDPELQRRLGAAALEREHGFVLRKGQPELEPHAGLELVPGKREPVVRLAGTRGRSIGRELRVPASVAEALADGTVLRGMRIEEDYIRRTGGHYDLEQRFVLATRVHLLPTDRPERFCGYTLTTFPRSTPGYQEWVERVIEALP